MGGKPSKGTSADRRLKKNKTKAKKSMYSQPPTKQPRKLT